jgi:hypothetical protein
LDEARRARVTPFFEINLQPADGPSEYNLSTVQGAPAKFHASRRA